MLQDERLYNMTYVNLAQSQEALVAEQAKNMIYASHGCIRRYELADRLNYSGEYLSRIMKKIHRLHPESLLPQNTNAGSRQTPVVHAASRHSNCLFSGI